MSSKKIPPGKAVKVERRRSTYDDRQPLYDNYGGGGYNNEKQPKKQKCWTILLRIVEILFLLAIIPCICQPEQICMTLGSYYNCYTVPQFYANNWYWLGYYSFVSNSISNVVGLYFALVTSCICLLLSVILFFCACIDYRTRIAEVFFLVLACMTTFVNFALMTWYAGGWWQICYLFNFGMIPCNQQAFLIQSWVAAAIILCLLFFVYLIDIVITAKYAPRRTRISREPKRARGPPQPDIEDIQYIEKFEKPKGVDKAIQNAEKVRPTSSRKVQPAEVEEDPYYRDLPQWYRNRAYDLRTNAIDDKYGSQLSRSAIYGRREYDDRPDFVF